MERRGAIRLRIKECGRREVPSEKREDLLSRSNGERRQPETLKGFGADGC